MPFSFWFDIASLSLFSLLAMSVTLVVIGLNPRNPVNFSFAAYSFFCALWSLFSLLLRFSLSFEVGDSSFFLEAAVLCLCLTGPLLLVFAIFFAETKHRFFGVAAALGLVYCLCLAFPLFTHRIVTNPTVHANGALSMDVFPLAFATVVGPAATLVCAFVLFIRSRRAVLGKPITILVLLLMAGAIAGFAFRNLVPLMAPVLLLMTGYFVLGAGLLRRQSFNPLKTTNEKLEKRVEERTRELEKAYGEIESLVEKRTLELEKEIAERTRTEDVLRESEEKFRNFTEQSPNMIFIYCDSHIVYANRKCEEVTGWLREELTAPEFEYPVLFASRSQELVRANLERQFRGETVPSSEYSLVLKSGRVIDVIITTQLVRFDGRLAVLGIVTDITERKHIEFLLLALNRASLALEQALTEDEIFVNLGNKLREIGFSCGIFLKEMDRRGLFLRYFGTDKGPLFVPDALAGVAEIPAKAMQIPDESEYAMKVFRQKRTLFVRDPGEILSNVLNANDALRAHIQETRNQCRAILSPIILQESVLGFLLIIGPNLLEKDLPAIDAFAYQIAAALKKASLVQDLKKSLSELERTQEQFLQSQKMEAVGKLAGGIAHDFNNLLTAIIGYADLLQLDAPKEEGLQTLILDIKKAANQAANLTRQLLIFSRKQVIQPVILPLNRVVGGMTTMLKRLIGEDIDLVFRLEAEPCTVRIDAGQIEQVIMNLTVNSRDAMPEGGTLVISTTNALVEKAEPPLVPGSYVQLSVKDQGVGMDRETRSRIFEPFFTTKGKEKGTGLGLSTVYGIVQQAEGFIRFESEQGKGTEFVVFLPQVEGVASVEKKQEEGASVPRGTETILLVEDEPMVRDLARKVLTSNGYAVWDAENAQAALSFPSDRLAGTDLLVTDIIMPGGMNGHQLAVVLKKAYPAMKILYISGYTENIIASQGILSPGIDFLQKPFTPVELCRKVREVLDRRSDRDGTEGTENPDVLSGTKESAP